MTSLWRRYGKAIVAGVAMFATGIQALVSDGHITQQEGVQILVAFFTAFSVWLVPVLHYPWMKTAIAVALGVLNVLATLIVGGVSSGDITIMIVAAATALGVGVAPARSIPTNPPPTERRLDALNEL